MRRRVDTTEFGAALTEFAILMPLLIAVFYGSVYLVDAGLLRIKAQEVARFSAWAFTQQRLSNYESPELRHTPYFTDAKSRVSDTVGGLYLDLDAARSSVLPGKNRQTMTAVLTPDPFALRQERAPVLPQIGTVDVPLPSGTAGLVMAALGLAGSTNDLAAGFYERAGMNGRGLVTGRATLTVLPPIRGANEALYSVAAGNRFDISGVVAAQQGRPIRDGDGPVDATLLVDSWRSTAGHAALPTESVESRRALAHVVERLHDQAPRVLPGGGLLGGLFNIIGATDAGKYVVSQPYLHPRPCGARSRTAFDELPGQVNPFRRAGVSASQLQEEGAVVNFETLPLYDQPGSGCSAMAEVLNDRGRNFMGCADSQKRRCR
ncbi:MAG: TadE family protein [Myxococcota bacterium]